MPHADQPEPSLAALALQARHLAASLASYASGSENTEPTRSEEAGDEAALGQLARNCVKARRLRDRLFEPGLFCDPAWDIMLDLFASETEGKNVCISDAGIAANVPQTTGLRWLDTLEKHGWIRRFRDPRDGRRWFVALTPETRTAMVNWLRSGMPC